MFQTKIFSRLTQRAFKMAHAINVSFPNGCLSGDVMTVRGASNSKENDFVKICVLGDIAVGKTSLAIRFIHDEFIPRYRPNFMINYFQKTVQNTEGQCKLMVWDTAGSERFQSMTSHYVRRASGCLLVFDVTERTSYENLINHWIPHCEDWAPGLAKVVVANKVDLAEHKGWAVNMKEVKAYCDEIGIPLHETSAKRDLNVELCFKDAAGLINSSHPNPRHDDPDGAYLDSFSLLDNQNAAEEERKKKKKLCCDI